MNTNIFRSVQILVLHNNLPSICSLQWNTSFPAITVCEMFNGEKTWDLSEKYVWFLRRHNFRTRIRFPVRNSSIVKLIQFTLSFGVNRYYGSNRHNKLDDFISDITFFNGKCYACNFCSEDMVCPSNFSDLTAKVGTHSCG